MWVNLTDTEFRTEKKPQNRLDKNPRKGKLFITIIDEKKKIGGKIGHYF